MTENPTPTPAPDPTESKVLPVSEVVITVDHVYLPIDATGNVPTDWAVTNVSTTKVLKRTRLQVPDELALQLSKQDQAEIV
ncbi:MAG TPA: hypothetical protein VEP47_04330 [Reyranella sp.]|nr:hypothetical protein [Reyranella sp.]